MDASSGDSLTDRALTRLARGLGRAAEPLLATGDEALDRVADAVGDASRTVRFLRGAVSFEPRPDDVYVASYPRSGTTWTQLIVHLLVTGERELSFQHISEVVPWWERSLAWRREAPRTFERLPSPRVFKTHMPYRWLPRVGRCIYLRRDPADVAVSYFHLYRAYLRFDGGFREFFARFLRGDLQYGSWFKHVAAWRRNSGNPRVLFLEYETMRADPSQAVQRIADFLEIEADRARIDEIVRASDIRVMKAHEDKFDHAGELRLQRGVHTGTFIGQGQTSGGNGHLSVEQHEMLDRLRQQPIKHPDLEWRLPDFLH